MRARRWAVFLAAVTLTGAVVSGGSSQAAQPEPATQSAPFAQRASVRAIPATALWNGQRVEVRGEGWAPGAWVSVQQCAQLCASAATSSEVGAAGAIRVGVTVRRQLVTDAGTTDCTTEPCRLEVVVAPPRGSARVRSLPLRFAGNEPADRTDFWPQPECVPWPTARWATGPVPDGVDATALRDLADEIVGDDASDSLVVIHGGRLVYERYAPGYDRDTVFASWSISKSFTSTMIGLQVQQGLLDLDARAPIAEWSDPADPRHAITLRNLLHMSSGLEWRESYTDLDSDIFEMFRTPRNADYPIAKPLVWAPGSRFRYSTGDSAILGRIIGDTAGVVGPSYEQYVHDALLDPLGIRPVVMGFDDAGMWLSGVRTNTTTRGFAKLGLLYLRHGVWEDAPLLDSDWVDFVRAPSPASDGYGGHFWLDGDGSFRMVGLAGQVVHIVPSLDLVVAMNNNAATRSVIDLFAGAQRPRCGGEPVLRDDTATVAAGRAVAVSPLRNDERGDIGLAPRTLTVSDGPAHGTAVVRDRRIRYVPTPGFVGDDAFRYVVCAKDRSRCLEATVRIRVTG